MTASTPRDGNPPGPAADAAGRTVVDPTENVKALNDAAQQRQDDLREAERRLTDSKFIAQEKLALERQAHVEDKANLRASHYAELRAVEASRLDSIRSRDAEQVQRAADVVAAQATTLAAQVATVAAASDIALKAALEPIQKDIAELRRTQYEAAGAKVQSTETTTTRRDSNQLGLAAVGVAVAVAAYFFGNGGG